MEQLILFGTDHHLVEPTVLGGRVPRDTVERQLSVAMRRRQIHGYVVLATCNRFEVYLVVASPADRELASSWCQDWFGGLASFSKQGQEVVQHLIRVAASLESMVVGESQILGQVKRAWQVSQERRVCCSMLNELFRRALQGAHEIRHETGLGTLPVSVASLGVRCMLERLRGRRRSGPHRVAIVGAGCMARKAALALAEQHGIELIVVNRTFDSAVALADRVGGTPMPLEEFRSRPPRVDAILVAARGVAPLIDRALLDRAGGAPPVLVDVCVPHGVAADVVDCSATEVIDMDELSRISRRNTAASLAAARAATPYVDHHVESLARRLRQQTLGLGEIHAAHLDLAEQQGEALVQRDFGYMKPDERERLRSHILQLAKAHAHLHISDVKRKASALCAS